MPLNANYQQVIGTFIDAWGTSVIDPFKFITPILADAPFEKPASEVGGVYHQPVMLTYEAGITHAGPREQPGVTSGRPYISPRAGYIPDAQVEGFQVHGRSRITYEAIARSMANVDAKASNRKKAVQDATKLVMNSLGRGIAKRCETLALHGKVGFGKIEAAGTTAQASTYEGVSGYVNDCSIDPLEWAEAIWAMGEGSTWDIYDTNASGQTKQNSASNTVLPNSQTGLVLIGINQASPSPALTSPVTATGRVLRFFHTTQGATGAQSLAANRYIYPESGGYAMEYAGLDVILSNTATLFNIDSGQWSMWGGNISPNVGNVKMAQLMEAIARPVNFGVLGTKLKAVVPTKLFTQFASDEASLRRYQGETSGKAENGFETLTYHAAGANTLEVIGHPLQKDGKIHIYVPEELHRVGAQDVGFVKRGGNNELILETATDPSSEVRTFGQFAIYLDAPRHGAVLTGVTY